MPYLAHSQFTATPPSGLRAGMCLDNEPFGPVNSFTDGNGIKETLTYDQDYRLTNILAKGNKTIQNLTYAYDGVSDITSITDAAAGTDKDQHRRHGFGRFGGDDRGRGDDGFSLSQSFTYDANMRLLTAAGAYGTQTYAYDADGNRTSFSVTGASRRGRFGGRFGRHRHGALTGTYTYASDSNRLTGITGAKNVQFSYTANGNLEHQSDGYNVRQFLYNARNRNTAIQVGGDGDDSAHYTYNALGERVQKSGEDRDDTTDFIYDEQGHLIAETQGGRVTKEYVYLGSLPVAELENNQVYYIHDDHLGAPQTITDANQRVVWSRAADPFGNTFAVKGDDDLTNLRFPGQYHDAESGLDYNMFRSYNPAIGRYTQSDPIGLLGGVNTYAYVYQNPMRWTDALGLAVLPNNTMGPLQLGDIWQSQVKNYPNAQVYTTPNGTQFLAPKNTNWFQIWQTGKNNGLSISDIGKNVGHSGTFDFQRIGGYHPEYIDASNYAVGVYMNGAGYTLFGTNFLGGAYSKLLSSGNLAVQKNWWDQGWSAGQGMSLSCQAPSNLQF